MRSDHAPIRPRAHAPARRTPATPVVPTCDHEPPCPPARATDHTAARVIARHHDQGWVRLCNGVIVFDDTGELLPDGRALAPQPKPILKSCTRALSVA